MSRFTYTHRSLLGWKRQRSHDVQLAFPIVLECQAFNTIRATVAWQSEFICLNISSSKIFRFRSPKINCTEYGSTPRLRLHRCLCCCWCCCCEVVAALISVGRNNHSFFHFSHSPSCSSIYESFWENPATDRPTDQPTNEPSLQFTPTTSNLELKAQRLDRPTAKIWLSEIIFFLFSTELP